MIIKQGGDDMDVITWALTSAIGGFAASEIILMITRAVIVLVTLILVWVTLILVRITLILVVITLILVVITLILVVITLILVVVIIIVEGGSVSIGSPTFLILTRPP